MLAFVALALLLFFVVPPLMTRGDTFADAAERLKAENDIRTAALQLLAGAVLALGAVFTGITLVFNREGQITERFTRAVEQLGNERPDVRLGGIYGLERIARDSKRDHEPVMEILTAYVRHNATPPPTDESRRGGFFRRRRERAEARLAARLPPVAQDLLAAAPDPSFRLAADIQGALTVIARRNVGHERPGFRVDLSGAYLQGADMKGAHLEGALLINTNLDGAMLDSAHLQRAVFSGSLRMASLRQANLEDADLMEVPSQRLNLVGASLRRANFVAADLTGANLRDADGEGALFMGSTLIRANLKNANLRRADLGSAVLREATLTNARVDDANFVGATLDDGEYSGEAWVTPQA